MRNRLTFISIQTVFLLLSSISIASAWIGESSFGPESREEIKRIAREMTDFSWSPTGNYNPWGYTFNAGQIYKGEAYTQNNPQENWAEFYSCFDNPSTNDYISGCGLNPQGIGNDCSGFVSMSWKLPTRWGTSNFINDATGAETYVRSLGNIGTGQSVNLLPGDAMVKDGHILLFESYQKNQYEQTIGINTWEQMCDMTNFGRCWADHIKDDSHRLWPMSSYRPIRRNNILDHYFNTTWGYYGTGNNQFEYPTGVAADPYGNVYVADYMNSRVQKFTNDGTYLRTLGSYGFNWGQFLLPTDVAADTSGSVYVADSGNCNIQKFNSSGSVVWNTHFIVSSCLFEPQYIAVDGSGNVYATDTNRHIIKKLNSSGTVVGAWGSYGSGNGQYINPTGIAVDSEGGATINLT